MIIGYARTSTIDQKYSNESQVEELQKAGAEKIFQEQVSAVGERPELLKLLEYARSGDCIIFTKLDRAFRSVRHMCEVLERLQEKEVHLRILDLAMDTTTASGNLILNVFTSVAQFERDMMKERQVEGIRRAQAEGKYKGRKKKGSLKQVKMLAETGLTSTEIQQETGLSRSTVYRYLKNG